jgi:hypothetical protein
MKAKEFYMLSIKDRIELLKDRIMYIQEFEEWNSNPLRYRYEIIVPLKDEIFDLPYDNKGSNHYKGINYTFLVSEYVDIKDRDDISFIIGHYPKFNVKERGTLKELDDYPEYFI